jgi:hypothetical protein
MSVQITGFTKTTSSPFQNVSGTNIMPVYQEVLQVLTIITVEIYIFFKISVLITQQQVQLKFQKIIMQR